ncbi:MAG: hypothetical protein LBC19_14845 [Tannerella sp.]|jgi:hypothetical protein|nr:hypothetical protein [Tannerella sp.]
MDETNDKHYVKKIIEEYNLFFNTWGDSDNWSQSQFKTLEDMLFEATKIQVNTNTLRRFFQQKTGNPQLATKEALCKFLGYSGYTDFVLKMTKSEKKTKMPALQISIPERETNVPGNEIAGDRDSDERTVGERMSSERTANGKANIFAEKAIKKVKNSSQKHIYIIMISVTAFFFYFLYDSILKEWYNNYQISKIEFSASKTKGTAPLTVSFSYRIPSNLFDDIVIVYEEANGDVTEKRLNKDVNMINATYIYEGEAYCYLKYKGEIIRTIPVVTLRPDWSVYVREERKKFFRTFPISDAYTSGNNISLPIEKVPEEARASHLFVSYVFYRENLVDGDNFLFEARMRNSEKEHAIPLSDIIMYISSDTHTHGFAMNENGYAYIKFISGENSIRGDEYNLSRFNFNSSEWHVMSIKVVHKNTTFYVDEEEVLKMSYNESLGMANELILRFKGCGAVDYVKVSTLTGEIVYQENFDSHMN